MNSGCGFASGLREVLNEHAIGLVAVEQTDEEIFAVFGDDAGRHARRMIGHLVDEPVGGLRLIERVEIHVGPARIVAASAARRLAGFSGYRL